MGCFKISFFARCLVGRQRVRAWLQSVQIRKESLLPGCICSVAQKLIFSFAERLKSNLSFCGYVTNQRLDDKQELILDLFRGKQEIRGRKDHKKYINTTFMDFLSVSSSNWVVL